MIQNRNPYLDQVRRALPRLLALYDTDKSSESYGLGDRFYWAWGLIDFPNGTFQGAASGMARLWLSGLWPYRTSAKAFTGRLDAMFQGARFSTQSDGSLQEAFPHEGSYCVTALAAFDLLQTIDVMAETGLSEEILRRWQDVVEPMIDYLKSRDETHAVISNHLATAIAALTRWHRLTRDAAAERRALMLLARVLDHQSEEGWLEEYGGADPGYETLCLHYLADVHQIRPDWDLIEPLRRSLQFLWHFAHPDGSFGGVYGSRCTRFYYPSGVLSLSAKIPEAAALARFMEGSIEDQKVVTLDAMDEPNLIPMFNSYCLAAAWRGRNDVPIAATPLPASTGSPARRHFPHAGLIIDRGQQHYTIISTHKGGTICHFPAGCLPQRDDGLVIRSPKGKLGSTQAHDIQNGVELQGDTLTVDASFRQMTKRLPGAVHFLALRLLCLTIFRCPPIREWAKRRLAKWLITGGRKWSARNRRTIRLGPNLEFVDSPSLPSGFKVLENHHFVPIHMASQGYWQIQDEEGQL